MKLRPRKMPKGNSDSGTSVSPVVTAEVKSEVHVQDTRPRVWVATKTFEWHYWYNFTSSGTSYLKIPIDAGLGVPSMTAKLSICMGLSNNHFHLQLSYDFVTNEEGKVCPMYEARVSAKYDGAPETVHQSAMQNTGGSCIVPLSRSVEYGSVWINFDFTFHFYDNRNNAAINFVGDTWNVRHLPCSTVDMLESGDYADVRIISSDGQVLNAHKLILSAKNEVFNAMFQNPMEETEAGVVRFDDMSGKAVKFLLYFIYSTQMLKISMKENDADGTDVTIAEVLHLVDKFGLTELKNYLDENLGKICNKDNSWYLFKLAKLHSLEKGRIAVYEFMKENNSEYLNEALLA